MNLSEAIIASAASLTLHNCLIGAFTLAHVKELEATCILKMYSLIFPSSLRTETKAETIITCKLIPSLGIVSMSSYMGAGFLFHKMRKMLPNLLVCEKG